MEEAEILDYRDSRRCEHQEDDKEEDSKEDILQSLLRWRLFLWIRLGW